MILSAFAKFSIAVFALSIIIASFAQTKAQVKQNTGGIEIVRHEAEQRVDVLIDGEVFTSYIWNADLKKPVLFPIRTAHGTIITRGFPLAPRSFESVDHPHQVGLWLNYGDVNGFDFWNNSIYRTPEELKKMGTIVQEKISGAKNGKNRGEFTAETDWRTPDGKKILREKTKFIFFAEKELRTIERITTLTALNEKVVFNDSKEGFLGLRVRRELEQPSDEPILLTEANGKPSKKPILYTANVTGEFRSSEGKTGDDVWGTRGKWAELSGKVADEPITIAIFDDPQNIGFPTHWMARGYGLFAANPLGQKAFSTEKKDDIKESKFTLEPKKSVTFRYRIVILSEKTTPEQIESQYQNFIKNRN